MAFKAKNVAPAQPEAKEATEATENTETEQPTEDAPKQETP